MHWSALLLAGVLSAPSPIEPPAKSPIKVVTVGRDLIFIRSTYPVQAVYLENNPQRYSHFVDYAPDRNGATVLLRTNQPILKLIVETSVRGSGYRRLHKFVFKNPSLRR